MNKHDNGGPAFPCLPPLGPDATAAVGYPYVSDGMSLRDYFAAKAMSLAYQYWSRDFYNPRIPDAQDRLFPSDIFDFDNNDKEMIAEVSYEMADAMLKAREA